MIKSPEKELSMSVIGDVLAPKSHSSCRADLHETKPMAARECLSGHTREALHCNARCR